MVTWWDAIGWLPAVLREFKELDIPTRKMDPILVRNQSDGDTTFMMKKWNSYVVCFYLKIRNTEIPPHPLNTDLIANITLSNKIIIILFFS